MGCQWSNGVEHEKNANDIVGNVTGRSKRDMDMDAVPTERKSMVHVELRAEEETIYRPKHLVFERQGSMDYTKSSENKTNYILRTLLDEPVGRFYFREYVVAKEVESLKELVDCWTEMELIFRDTHLRDTTAINTHLNSTMNKSGGDVTKVALVPPPLSFAQRMAELLSLYIDEDANFPVPLKSEHGKEKLEKARTKLVQGVIKVTDAATARKVLAPLQNAIFREIVESGHVETFRLHSEYKRYRMKMSKVYNAVSHRDFNFMATLGKGSFGRVLAAQKKTTKQMYALKVMSKKKILSGAESSAQVTIERNVLVTCHGCPFIVSPFFAFQTTRALFLALELLEGGNLVSAMHHAGGSLPLKTVQFNTAQIILGLAYLHKHGILYRDLKPLNIMLDRHGNAVLTDMGLCAKIKDSEFPKHVDAVNSTGQKLRERKSMDVMKMDELKCVGTFGFRAPEVLKVESKDDSTHLGYGAAVDYWALGVTVFYILQGKLPFKEKLGKSSLFGGQVDSRVQEKKLHQNIRNWPDSFDESLKALLDGLLAIEPEDRLGCDVPALKKHKFFEGIDWDLLEAGKFPAPAKPKVVEFHRDTLPQFTDLREAMSNFSADNVLEMFGGENDMQDEYSHVKNKDQRLFKDWDYYPDESLEEDWADAVLEYGVSRRDTVVAEY